MSRLVSNFVILVAINVSTQYVNAPLDRQIGPLDLLIMIGAELRSPFPGLSLVKFAYSPGPQLKLSIFAPVFIDFFFAVFAHTPEKLCAYQYADRTPFPTQYQRFVLYLRRDHNQFNLKKSHNQKSAILSQKGRFVKNKIR